MTLPSAVDAADVTLTGITRYPVKSCRREEMSSAVVERWGLAGDRRWMLVDADGLTFTARECAALLLVVPTITDDGLSLAAPGLDALRVARPEGGALVDVEVWSSHFPALPAAAEASDWFRRLTGEDVRLVYLDDPGRRAVNQARSEPGDAVSFADGYPVLLGNEASLAALNEWVAEGPRGADGPLPMTRFRPNLVVSGAEAWAEDAWRRIRIGGTSFRVVKGCDRCVMTLVDPETITKTKEPILSLSRHRRWDRKTWFAVNLIPDNPGDVLSVGDPVEVLEQVESTEPQR
ncbi:MAG TPA: MOSC N-terminal beta barrel domain-containing protein [Propionibacteriaceae bacterium]